MHLSDQVIVIEVHYPEEGGKWSMKHFGTFDTTEFAKQALRDNGWACGGEWWILTSGPKPWKRAKVQHVLPIFSPDKLPAREKV